MSGLIPQPLIIRNTPSTWISARAELHAYLRAHAPAELLASLDAATAAAREAAAAAAAAAAARAKAPLGAAPPSPGGGGGGGGGGDGGNGSGNGEEALDLKAELVAFYAEQNPAKLPDVARLAAQWAGSERAMLAVLYAQVACAYRGRESLLPSLLASSCS